MVKGSRLLAETHGGGWQNPYVTDGLIAMWDGEWNAGGGVHDANATTWVDLSGNGIDMISNGEPNFGANYVTSTKVENLWHTDETNLVDGIFTNGTFTIEHAIQMADTRASQKLAMLGGGALTQGICAQTAQTGDGRVGGEVRVQGSGSTSTYASLGFSGKLEIHGDGSAYGFSYTDWSGGTTSRSAPISSLPVGYVSKRFAIGYRYTYSSDSPTVNGMKFYCIRVYNRALTAAEIAANYAIDKARFNLP